MEERLLTSLGLNAKEVKVYKAVLKAREASPAQLAKSVGIKRTTVYSIARGLVEKGFLLENGLKRPRTFKAASPADVERVTAEERKRLAVREKMLKQFASELSRITADEEYPVPAIRFIEEGHMKQFLNSSMERWNESMMRYDCTYWGFQDHTYAEHFPGVIDLYWRRAPKEIVLKLLSNKSLTEVKLKGKYPRRHIKVWSKATNFVSSIWVMGDYVTMANTRRHPFYMVEIHDATLANDLREVFKNLWQLV